MEEIKLDVQIRKEVGTRKIKPLKKEDVVPAIVYGLDKPTTLIKVDKRSYQKIMRVHKGESVVFHLKVLEGEKKLRDYSAIVKEEQLDPVSDNLQHIDFMRISLTEEIAVKVSLVAKGEAPGVTKEGGSLDHALWDLDIVCLPTQIPAHINVDVSQLMIGDAIHVKDLVLPAGVRTEHDPEAIVFSVVPPMREEAEEPEGEEGSVEPELIKEKKEETPSEEESGETKEEE